MKCTNCTSENTQRLEVLYKIGTQNIATTSNSAGAGIGGGFGFGGVRTSTSGKSQSLLASEAAPPEKQKLTMPIILIVIGFLMLISLSSWDVILSGVVLLALGGFLFIPAYKYNKNEWPGKFQEWKNSWVCHKCGKVYIDEY